MTLKQLDNLETSPAEKVNRWGYSRNRQKAKQETERDRLAIYYLIENYYLSTGLDYGIYFHALPNLSTLRKPYGELRESDSAREVKPLFRGTYPELINYLKNTYYPSKGLTPIGT